MSEGTQAETIVEMLNEYFEPMVETLFKYEGTLDKFMGDGIMAFWGAPVAHRDDAVRCVQCALDQMEVLGRFNRQRMGENKPPLAVGIGIHTGPGVVGYVGSSKALSYTVIGDTANTSARLCATAAAGQIVAERGHAGAPRGPLRVRGDRGALAEGQREADAPLQRRAREAERGGEGRLTTETSPRGH